MEKYHKKQNRYSDTSKSYKDDSTVYSVVEEMPYFPDGKKQLKKYLKRANFSQTIVNNSDNQGRIYIRFVVNKSSNVLNIALAKPDTLSLDSTSRAHIRNMPKWQPGKMNGDPVRVQQVIPVKVR